MAPRRILIIEDEMKFGEQLAEALQYEGFSADHCPDPFRGEGLVRSGKYDIVLLDYTLPGCSAVDFLKRLKAEGIRRSVFIVTGRPSVEEVVEAQGLSDMVEGIIYKPFDFEDLLAAIRNCRRE